jgi:rubrerythrin
MNKLYQKKHELWLEVLFASFAISDETIKARLYEFSLIAFRHMKWIGDEVLANKEDYNYDRAMQLHKHTEVFALLKHLVERIQATMAFYPQSVLGERLKSDDAYLLSYIATLLGDTKNNAPITAFNMQRKWPNKALAQEQIDALTMFLFEESYKEYELILIYAYMQARTEDVMQFSVFNDLVDESQFHLKSFGEMMAKLGILTLPRELHAMTYQIKDLKKFLRDGIAEEEAAKEMCRSLAASIKDEEFAQFFDFINFQESYHIELMKKLLGINEADEMAMTNLDFDEFWDGVEL